MGRLPLGSWSLVQDTVLQAAVAVSCACEACRRTSGCSVGEPQPNSLCHSLACPQAFVTTTHLAIAMEYARCACVVAAKPAGSPAAGLLTPNTAIELASCSASGCSPVHLSLLQPLPPPHTDPQPPFSLLPSGGDLFDYVVARGRLTEDVARFYFQQLVCGVAWCHSKVWAGGGRCGGVRGGCRRLAECS